MTDMAVIVLQLSTNPTADGSGQYQAIFTILRCGRGVSNSQKNPTALMEKAISSVRNRSGAPMNYKTISICQLCVCPVVFDSLWQDAKRAKRHMGL